MCPLSVDQYNNTGDWLLDQHRLVSHKSCFHCYQKVANNIFTPLPPTWYIFPFLAIGNPHNSIQDINVFSLQSLCV